MNKTLPYLIVSDIFIISAFGLFAPIFAIFLNSGIEGGSITAAGLASAIFFLVKSIVQLPMSMHIDKKRNKLPYLFFGTFLIAVVPFIYAFARNVNFIYVAQAIYGLGAAIAVPSWVCLFTMHIDRKHRGFEWSIWSVSIGIGTGLAAYLGTVLQKVFGFKILFIIVGVFSFLGFLILLFLSKKFLKDIEKVGMFGFDHKHKLK